MTYGIVFVMGFAVGWALMGLLATRLAIQAERDDRERER